MTLNPILKVLLTFREYGVKSLLIGGQACIVYGAAEFSRDSDFVILGDAENLGKLNKALRALKAENIYVPPLKAEYLMRGHACHFRCRAAAVNNLRIDVLAKLKGCDGFDELWQRKSRVSIASGTTINVIGLADLVQAKKTQRDKDWLMLARLVENDMALPGRPSWERIRWWLCECRNAGKLVELAANHPQTARECLPVRPLLQAALANNEGRLTRLLKKEELHERQKDRIYWEPLKKELEKMRHEYVAKNRIIS